MFTCRDSIDLLQRFLDGEMPEEERHRLKEHLDACPPCVDFLRTYRATPGLCRKAMVDQMPRELSKQLTAFLRQRLRK
ncbi:MAG: zf-HC2 domain-containing protein [Myxococcales bacterium]|nr:zf-HC2 domain-containing protein [Myxococcales bacterium]